MTSLFTIPTSSYVPPPLPPQPPPSLSPPLPVEFHSHQQQQQLQSKSSMSHIESPETTQRKLNSQRQINSTAISSMLDFSTPPSSSFRSSPPSSPPSIKSLRSSVIKMEDKSAATSSLPSFYPSLPPSSSSHPSLPPSSSSHPSLPPSSSHPSSSPFAIDDQLTQEFNRHRSTFTQSLSEKQQELNLVQVCFYMDIFICMCVCICDVSGLCLLQSELQKIPHNSSNKMRNRQRREELNAKQEVLEKDINKMKAQLRNSESKRK
jgi:hypothetical protein